MIYLFDIDGTLTNPRQRISKEFEDILTLECLEFIAELHRKFNGQRLELLKRRQEVQKKMQPVIEELFGKIPSEVKQRYAHWGGSPSLDNNYTVFGKLVSGYNVLSAIEKEPTGSGDRPKKDVKIIEAFIPE